MWNIQSNFWENCSFQLYLGSPAYICHVYVKSQKKRYISWIFNTWKFVKRRLEFSEDWLIHFVLKGLTVWSLKPIVVNNNFHQIFNVEELFGFLFLKSYNSLENILTRTFEFLSNHLFAKQLEALNTRRIH